MTFTALDRPLSHFRHRRHAGSVPASALYPVYLPVCAYCRRFRKQSRSEASEPVNRNYSVSVLSCHASRKVASIFTEFFLDFRPVLYYNKAIAGFPQSEAGNPTHAAVPGKPGACCRQMVLLVRPSGSLPAGIITNTGGRPMSWFQKEVNPHSITGGIRTSDHRAAGRKQAGT